MENRIKGYINITLTLLFLTYYTLWVIGLPFVDAEYASIVHKIFPPVEFALGIPCLIVGNVFLILLGQAYYMVIKDRKVDKII